MIQAIDQILEEAGPLSAQARLEARVRAHVLAQLVCLGEHTITGLLCASGRQGADWTADYRLYTAHRVHTPAIFAAVRRGVEARLAPDQPLVVALDDSLLRKRGRTVFGAAWRPDPLGPPFQIGFAWSQRVLQLAVALPEGSEGAARTVPIDFVHAPTAPRPRKHAPPEAWAAYRQEQKRLNINVQAAARVDALVHARPQEAQARPVWITVDGRFTNRTFFKKVPAQTVIIGRLRGDARLHQAVSPHAPSRSGGRPRYYGPVQPTPEELRQNDQIPWQMVEAFAAGQRHVFKIKTLEPLRWRVAGAHRTLRLVVIAPLGYRLGQGRRVLYRKPAYLICTDPNLPLDAFLQAYLWRWGIEVNFRDEKTLLGVGQARVRHPRAVERVPQLAVAAYAVLLLAAARTAQPLELPLPAWRRASPPTHATTAQLINQLRYELWADAFRPGLCDFMRKPPADQNAQKPRPCLETAVFYALAG